MPYAEREQQAETYVAKVPGTEAGQGKAEASVCSLAMTLSGDLPYPPKPSSTCSTTGDKKTIRWMSMAAGIRGRRRT